MTRPWMIDELAYAGFEHLDPAFVAGFDRKQGYPDPAEDLASLREHGIDRGSTVVDLGAGTGRFALAVAPQVARVVAVDVSPAMLAVIGERVAQAGLSNVECVRGGFLSYEHAGPPADAVFTRNALHQLPDFWKALALDRIAVFDLFKRVGCKARDFGRQYVLFIRLSEYLDAEHQNVFPFALDPHSR